MRQLSYLNVIHQRNSDARGTEKKLNSLHRYKHIPPHSKLSNEETTKATSEDTEISKALIR